MLQARLARRAIRRYRQSRRFRLEGAPVLFANSFPKSGTHLLTQVLAGFSQLGPAVVSGLPAITAFEGESGRQRTEAEILRELGRLLPGDIAYGHLHATPDVCAALCAPGFAAYFMLRDPRDVVVSHLHYVTEMAPGHALHAYYQQALSSFDERLRASIQGVDEASAGARLQDIRARFEPYLGWLERSEVLALRYEDFLTGRAQALERVFDHAMQRGFASRCDKAAALEILEQSIAPERSPTFRRGISGGWRAAFNPEHKALFKDLAGDLLVQLGYETGQDW
jgi:hypothetical protein